MQGWRWERLAPLGAFGFAGSLVLGALILGETPPSSKAPAEEIAAYFADHRSGVLFNTSMAVFGGFTLYPWFLASLWRAARRNTATFAVLALIGGVSLLGPLLLQAAGWGAAALEAGPARDASVAVALMDLGNIGLLLVPMPAAVLVAGTTLAARSGGFLPAWLHRAGLPLAAALAVGGVITFLPQLLFGVLVLWMLVVATVLFRQGGRLTGPQ